MFNLMPFSVTASLVIYSIAQWFEAIEIDNPQLARLCCQLIPASCPFERDIYIFNRKFHIPPLCKLNPFYEQLMGLRFKALSYLADVCGEDVTLYYQ